MQAHEHLPAPLGLLAELLAREQHPIVRLERIRASFEASLKLLTAVALICAHQTQRGARPDSRLLLDARRFFNDAPTLGYWDLMLRRTLRAMSETPDALVDPQVYLTVYRDFGRSPAATPLFASNGGSWDALLKFRNDLAHGAPGTSERARMVRSEIEPHIDAVFEAMAQLRLRIVQLARPSSESASWVVYDADGNSHEVELRNRLEVPLHQGSLAAIDPGCSWGVPLSPVMEASSSGSLLFFNDQKKRGRVVYLDYASGEKDVRYDDDPVARVIGTLFAAPAGSHETDDLFAALVAGKTRHFVGREDALHWLDGATQTRFSIVTGPPGIGKTSLLAKWTEDRHVVRHFFRANDVVSVSPRNVLGSLVRQAERLTGVRARERDADDPAALLASWRQILASIDEPALVVLDGLDEALDSNEELLNILPDPDVVPPCVSFILSGRPQVLEHHRVGPIVNRTLQLTSLTLDETRVLLTTAFNTYEILRDDGLAERVFKKSQGHPLYLQLLIEDALEGRVTLDDLDRIPNGLPAFYRRAIERFEPASGEMSSADLAVLMHQSGVPPARVEEILTQRNRDRDTLDLLALVALLREPLGVDDLAGILRSSPDGIRRVVRRARSVLTEDGTGRLSLFHESFREYLRSESVGMPALTEAYERSAQGLMGFCTAPRAIGSTYTLQHWHWHLLDAAKAHRPWGHVSKQTALQELSRLAHDRAWLSAQEATGVHLPTETATAWLYAATATGSAGSAFEAGALLIRVSKRKRSIQPSLMSGTFDELQSAIQVFDPISHPALRLGWVLCQRSENQRYRALLSLLEHCGQRPKDALAAGSELFERRYPLPALLKLQYRIVLALAADGSSLKPVLPELATALGGAQTVGLPALTTARSLLSTLRERSSHVDDLELLAWLQTHTDDLLVQEVEGILLEVATRPVSQQVMQWGIEYLIGHEGLAEAVRVLEALQGHVATVIAVSLLAKGTLPGLAEREMERAIARGIGDLLTRDEVPQALAKIPPRARAVIERALHKYERTTLGVPAGQHQHRRITTERLNLARAWLAMGDVIAAQNHIDQIAGPIPSRSVGVAQDLAVALAKSHMQVASELVARVRGVRDIARVTSRCVGMFPHLEVKLARGYRRIESEIMESASRSSLNTKALASLLEVLEHRPDVGRTFPLEPFIQMAAGNEGQRGLLADVYQAVATADARASLMKSTDSTEPVRAVELGASQRVQVSTHSQLGLAAAIRRLVRPTTVGELISRVRIVAAAVQNQHETVATELANLAPDAVDDALDVLVSVLATDGDFTTARQYAGEISNVRLRDMTNLFIIGRLAGAAKADDAIRLCGQLTAGEAKCEGYLAVAKSLIDSGDVGRAIDTTVLATQALLEAPHTDSLSRLRRESLLTLARMGHLITIGELLALNVANDAPSRVELALESYRAGHVDTAVCELNKLAQQWTGNGQHSHGGGTELVRAMVEAGLGEAALEVAKNVERASGSNTVWFYLAVEAGGQSFKELALEAVSRGFAPAATRDEARSDGYFLTDEVVAIAEMLAKLGYNHEAMELLRNTVDTFEVSTIHDHDASALRRVLDAIDAALLPLSEYDTPSEEAASGLEPLRLEEAVLEKCPDMTEPDPADFIHPDVAAYLSDLNTKTGLIPALKELPQDDSVNQAAFKLLLTAGHLVAAEEFTNSIPDDIELTYCLLVLAKVAIRAGLAEYAARIATTDTEVSDEWEIRKNLLDFAVQHARYRVAEALVENSDDRLDILTAQLLAGHITQRQALERLQGLEGEVGKLRPTASKAAFALAVGKHEDAFAAVRALGFPSSAVRLMADVASKSAARQEWPQTAAALTEFCAEQPFLLPYVLPTLLPFCKEDRDRILMSLSGE